MTSGLLLRPRLIAALKTAIEQVQSSSSHILLAQPPFIESEKIQVVAHPGTPLPEAKELHRNQPHFFLNEWPHFHLHSIRFPYLAYLLEGEIDWRIGVSKKMAKTLPESLSQNTYFTLSLREGQFFLMPPGVPYSDGSHIHWRRGHPEQAHYKILWIHLLPTGSFCHLSGVLQGEYFYDPPLYIHDSRIHLLSEFLLEELETRDSFSATLARNQLHSILLRIQRHLAEQPPFLIFGGNQEWRHESAQQDIRAVLIDETTTTVQRACAYIEAHLHTSLQADIIARQVLVSLSQLNRMFRKELGVPIMRYVTERRVKIAQGLLAHSQLPIAEIGRQIGYPNPSHFSQVLTREIQQSPKKYREQQQPTSRKLDS